MLREFRRDAAVRLLTVLAVVTLFLSLGPYVPGFRALIAVPGFSFFRAPSRWSVSTALALALLSGKGFDRWREWPRPHRWLRAFVLLTALGISAELGLIELALWSTRTPGHPGLARVFESAFRALPWANEPAVRDEDSSFRAVMARARQPTPDRRIPADLSLAVVLQKAVADRTFAIQRGSIYCDELATTAALLVALLVVAQLSRAGRTRTCHAALAMLTIIDLWLVGRHRLIDDAPCKPLESQSPLLARLSREPRGTRIADPTRNLPMLVGLAPLSYYRTLNIPAVEGLTSAALGPMSGPVFEPLATGALWATGTSLRVFSPIENRVAHVLGRAEHADESIEDPALAGWLYGSAWTAEVAPWINKFTIWRSEKPPTRAWLVPLTGDEVETMLDESSGRPDEILAVLDQAEPLAADCSQREVRMIAVEVTEPAWVIVSQLYDPQWSGRWVGVDGQGEFEAEIRPTFRKRGEPGGWQRVGVPGEGRWMLFLEYEPRDVMLGIAISVLAWASWVTCLLCAGFHRLARPHERAGTRTGLQP
jgi:hypothetical protein